MKASRIFFMLLMLPLPAAAQAQQNVDVANFDIDGIKLYMSADEVMKNLHARFPKGHIRLSKGYSMLHPTQLMVDSIVLKDGDNNIQVSFREAIPPSKANEQVESISVDYDEKPDPDTNYSRAFFKEIVGKYGNPNGPGMNMDDGRTRDYWCAELLPSGEMEVYSYPCDPSQPYMVFWRNGLRLQDDSLEKRVTNYWEAHQPKPPPKPLPKL